MTDHADASLQNAVRELLEDMNRQHSSNTDSDSDLRWTLEKKVETDPSCGAGLVRVLVAELEQRLRRMSEVDETSAYVHVIPLLHTLHSVVVQSGAAVPAGLLQDVLSCLRRTLSLPLPYSAVAKRTLRSIRTEETKPGSLCLRRVTAEQNLMQEQERVFVLAEPAVFSAPLEASVKRFLESDALEDAAEVQRVLVLRVLHKALGSTCQSSRVAQALQALDDRALEQTFQDVTAAAEQGFGTGGRAAYVDTLERIQEELLTAWTQDAPTGSDGSPPAAMPPPRISFYRWNDEKQLSKLLEKFTLLSSAGVDREENKTGDLSASRRSPPRRLTARVVLMGDDRALGRLARAYLALRKRESKRLKLTKKLNIEFYYVPVTAVEPWHRSPNSPSRNDGKISLARFLERVDPWYKYNIGSLGATVSSLPVESPHLLDTLCYYLRCGTQPVNLPVYSVKMRRGDACVEDVFVSQLEAEMPEFRHLKHKPESSARKPRRQTVAAFGGVINVSYTATSLSKRHVTKADAPMTCGLVIRSEPAAAAPGEDFLSVRFDSVNPQFNTKIQTRNITIKTIEHRTLSVCLDKDARRKFTDVQSIEVAPCLDPRRSILPGRFLDKVLSLPINTFCGFSP
ncbi:phosphoinositide 3-kinase regulatory subunit 6 isoform X2 [Betta splendens]|uniref:Phosphoinositide 3-kinase regulatory subunit 6 isoform X2 n=1 Tax=Betta splendens TaxID=158456 RepID=A0A6P7N4R8_BETSP|nr:phosphoinositide 3-kinase regulatory subunit 6 isoform X2 [Betta splendens]